MSERASSRGTELAESLVAELRSRSFDGFDALLRHHGAEIQAVAFLILRNERDAEEVLSDTLVVAWRKIDTLRDPARLRPWLLTTATRLALRRRRSLRPRIVSLDAASGVAARDDSPIDRLRLQEAINALPPQMRAAVALRDVADLPIAEVAVALGKSENTIKSQLREAHSRLRLALAADEPHAGAPDGPR